MSTEYQLPESAPQAEELLPEFNNTITPKGQPEPPVLTEPVSRVAIDPSVAPVPSTEYVSPVEAVPGVGGIPGVSAEG